MSRFKVGRLYARALSDSLGPDADGAPQLEVLDGLVEAVTSHAGLARLVADVTIDPAKKAAVLTQIAGRLEATDEILRLIHILARNRRLDCLVEIRDAFRDCLEKKHGSVRVRVTTPEPLKVRARQSLEKRLRQLAESVVLEADTQPQLLAGAVLRIGSRVWDGSLRGRLDRLRREMTKE